MIDKNQNFIQGQNLELFQGDYYGRYTVELVRDKKTVNSWHATFDEESFPGLQKLDSS